MGISRRGPDLPEFLELKLREFAGEDGMARAKAWMRPADQLMRVETLRRFKASRLSFADMLLRKVVRERRQICLLSQECQDDGAAKFVYRIDAGRHSFTYIARAYAWDGVEKVGRRSDGANRDMFGALFVGVASDERIAREFATFDKKAEGQMRTDADVIGWTPANRSSRHFDSVVDALARGDRVELRGFCAFSVKHRPSRVGRNPRSGEAVSIEEKWAPFFKAGKELRDRLNGEGRFTGGSGGFGGGPSE